MKHPEFKSCTALVKWWDYACHAYGLKPRHLSHIANQGSHGNPRTGAVLKAMGVRAGHADYFLSVAKGGMHGLYIEMKSPKGRVSPEQAEDLDLRRRSGYGTCIAYSLDEAINVIDTYLNERMKK